MQLKVFITLDEDLILPINYNHILQGIIYTASNYIDKRHTTSLHNSGIDNDYIHNAIKLFTFSKIIGPYTIVDKKIIFTSNIYFEVRSIDSYFIHLVYEGFKSKGIRFKDSFFIPRLELYNKVIRDNTIFIQMLSPIVATRVNDEGKKIFISPYDEDFGDYIIQNFHKKYFLYYNADPLSYVDITPADITYRDKVVSSYKGIYLVAWNGNYYLKGEPHILTFLYNVGLGSRNSQGYGMFNIIDE